MCIGSDHTSRIPKIDFFHSFVKMRLRQKQKTKNQIILSFQLLTSRHNSLFVVLGARACVAVASDVRLSTQEVRVFTVVTLAFVVEG